MGTYQCPYCAGYVSDEGGLAGQVVMCPHCGGEMQLPRCATAIPLDGGHGSTSPSSGSGFPAVDTGRTNLAASYRRKGYGKRQTDIYAIVCFASGLLGLFFLPELLTPVCYICAIVSHYRIKENRNLKGNGLRISGALMGIASMLFLFWKYQIGFFAP